MDEYSPDYYAASSDDYNADNLDCAVCADVLVDPCTLVCGHNFCELCLAKVWKEKISQGESFNVGPENIECPFCRRPWFRFPEINRSLRSIVLQKYSGIVDAKLNEYQQTDKDTLEQFHKAKLTPLPTGRRVGLNFGRRAGRRPINNAMALLLLVSLLVFGALMLGLLIYILIMAGDGVSSYVYKPVTQWDKSDVADWVSSIAPFARDTVSQLMLDEGINGAHLLELDDEDLQELGVDMATRRRTLLLAIAELKEENYLVPKSFPGFKEKYFQETVTATVLYVLWPRHTFIMLYLTNHHLMFLPLLRFHFPDKVTEEDVPAISPSSFQLVAFCLLLLISPHYVLLVFAWSWREMEPFISMAVCLHCLTGMLTEAKALYQLVYNRPPTIPVKIMHMLWATLKSTVTQFVPAVLACRVVWYVVPNFVWSGLLYLIIFFAPSRLCFQLVTKLLTKLPIFRRNNRVNINVQADWNVR